MTGAGSWSPGFYEPLKADMACRLIGLSTQAKNRVLATEVCRARALKVSFGQVGRPRRSEILQITEEPGLSS